MIVEEEDVSNDRKRNLMLVNVNCLEQIRVIGKFERRNWNWRLGQREQRAFKTPFTAPREKDE